MTLARVLCTLPMIILILHQLRAAGAGRRWPALFIECPTRRRPQAAGPRHKKINHRRIGPQAAGHRTANLESGPQVHRQIKMQGRQRACMQEKNLRHHTANGWYAMQSVRVAGSSRYSLLFLIPPIRVRRQCTDSSPASLQIRGSQSVASASFLAGVSSMMSTDSSL